MQTNSIGIIFISGAGLGSWIWSDVGTILPYPSLVIDFEKLKQSSKNITLSDYVREAMKQIKTLQTERFIIVAHSAGGVIGTEVASQLEGRLEGFVAISAALPKKGSSFLSTLPFPQNIITRAILKLAGTKPPESALKAGLCTDLDATRATKIVASFSPESIHLYTDPTTTRVPEVRSAYLLTTKDVEFPSKLQHTMARQLHSPTIVQLSTGHLPMLTQPDTVSAAITALIKGQS